MTVSSKLKAFDAPTWLGSRRVNSITLKRKPMVHLGGPPPFLEIMNRWPRNISTMMEKMQKPEVMPWNWVYLLMVPRILVVPEAALSRDSAVQPLIHQKPIRVYVNFRGLSHCWNISLPKPGPAGIKTDLDPSKLTNAIIWWSRFRRVKHSAQWTISDLPEYFMRQAKHQKRSDKRVYNLQGSFGASGSDTVSNAKLVYESQNNS